SRERPLKGALRDAVMITAAQKVEHYEIASVWDRPYARHVLGEPEVARLLEDTLHEEKNADLKLTEIAEGQVNDGAAEEWHQVSIGLLAQTASFAGKAIDVGARTVQRAAEAANISQSQLRAARNAEIVEQVTSSVNRAVEAAGETVRE